uniref:Uncharacterized protein n=1 Tax=Arundo donax TaxID=35708 RepID=A0A0A8XYQ8_ARUDO
MAAGDMAVGERKDQQACWEEKEREGTCFRWLTGTHVVANCSPEKRPDATNCCGSCQVTESYGVLDGERQ